jgi:NTF2-related export protein 1/2
MPPTHYEVQSYDCQVINPNYVTPGVEPSAPKPASGRHGGGAAGAVAKTTSILVLVSGYVRFGEERTKETWDLAGNRGFSETIVLVPNPLADRGRGMRQWLIQSQNFRLVV